MPQDWDFFFRSVENTEVGGVRTASVFSDLALRDRAPEQARPWLLRVAIPMHRAHADGLSDESEAEALYAIEDDLFSHLARTARARYVGRITTGGQRTHFYYLPPETAVAALVETIVPEVLSRHPEYTAKTTLRHDPHWDTFRDELAPNALEYQSVQTRRTIDRARESGEELALPRPVHHWADFPSSESREQFLAQIRGQGFEIEELALEEAHLPDLPYAAKLSRRDTLQLEFLDGLVTDLVIRAEDSGGAYRGWAAE
jgi:hypothetical protein